MLTDSKLEELKNLAAAAHAEDGKHIPHGTFVNGDNPRQARFHRWMDGNVPVRAPTWNAVRDCERFGAALFDVGRDLVEEVARLRHALRSIDEIAASAESARDMHDDVRACVARALSPEQSGTGDP